MNNDEIRKAIIVNPFGYTIDQIDFAKSLARYDIKEDYAAGFYDGFMAAEERLTVNYDEALRLLDAYASDVEEVAIFLENKAINQIKEEEE